MSALSVKWIFQYIGVGAVLLVLQATVGRLVAIENVQPDFLLIWIIFVALRRGQLSAVTIGSLVGLVTDLASGEFLGVGVLAKATAGFLSGFFYRSNQIAQSLGSPWFLGIVFLVGIVHNVIFFFFYLQGTHIGFWTSFRVLGILSAVYTTAFAAIPNIVYRRRYEEWGELSE